MSIFTENQEPMFASKEHYEFFKQTCERLNADCYLKALIYTVGISEDTRSRWSSFYDEKERTIKPEVINSGWQTSGSVRITRLAFQLFTDSTPTAIEYDKDDNPQYSFKECQLYSVSDTFCCSYAPFFVEAVKLRYPDYFSPRKVYRQKKKPTTGYGSGLLLIFQDRGFCRGADWERENCYAGHFRLVLRPCALSCLLWSVLLWPFPFPGLKDRFYILALRAGKRSYLQQALDPYREAPFYMYALLNAEWLPDLRYSTLIPVPIMPGKPDPAHRQWFFQPQALSE